MMDIGDEINIVAKYRKQNKNKEYEKTE